MNKEEEINKLWHIYYAHLLKFPNKDKKTMTDELKLYLWDECLWRWCPGFMFAFATSVEEARALILAQDLADEEDFRRKYPRDGREDISKWRPDSAILDALKLEPTIYIAPMARLVWGCN